jgi:D-alanine-D-alanine ligase
MPIESEGINRMVFWKEQENSFTLQKKIAIFPRLWHRFCSMKKKIHVGIVFGGRSSEHQVSLVSAKSVLEAIPRDKYEPVMIGIDLSGTWHHIQTDALLLDVSSIDSIHLPSGETQLTADMGNARAPFTSLEKKDFYESIDVVFPILHGKNGEDGTMQGFLQLMDIPFVGPETLGSAIGMDKDVCKRLLRDAGISVAKWVTIRKDDKINMELLEKTLGFPMFVKPANAGSSVGVGKAKNITDLLKAHCRSICPR